VLLVVKVLLHIHVDRQSNPATQRVWTLRTKGLKV
jgi:hypothetical protein